MKKIDKLGYITIIITIILLNIFIGSNIKEPIWIIQTIVSTIALAYIITKKIQKEKNIIIKGKIDIAVLIFMISTIIPFIFKNYVSLEGTINFILKYWSVYGLYILTRNVIKEDKQIKSIINTVIISSIIPIIFGYDKILNLNIFDSFLNSINSVKIEDTRMISTFGYANTFAVYLTLTTSLAIGILTQEKKRYKKILYITYIIIASITIALTQSKAVLALIAVTILIFIIKGIKEKKIIKKWIVAGIIAIILFLIYFFIAIQIPKDLVITQEEKTCVIRGIEKNKKYNLEFDINAESNKNYDTYKIVVVEITRHFSEKQLGMMSFAEFNGKKYMEIETDDVVSHLEIRITNNLGQKITIKDFKINDEPYILEYKIIPDELVRIFTTFNFKNTSVFQRFDFWGDSLEIIKDNWLLGAGGNTWRNSYGQVQDYLYYAKEAHSYPLEIFMSFGIIGILSYIFIVAITTQNSIKQLKDKEILSIFVGIAIILVHSIMDFDMSYLIMEMLVFMFIAILNKEDKNIKIKKDIIEYVVSIIFGVIVIGNIMALATTLSEDKDGTAKLHIAKWLNRYNYNEIIYMQRNNIQNEEKIQKISEYIENEPFMRQNTMYELMANSIVETLNKNNIQEKIKQINYLKDTLNNVKMERNYDVTEIQKRADIIIELCDNLSKKNEEMKSEELDEKIKELLQIIIDEYPEKSKKILEYDRNHEGKAVSKIRYENYTSTYKKAVKNKEKINEIIDKNIQ